MLVDHIVWRTSGTVADIADSCKACLTSGEKSQNATIFIIFAQQAYAKDHERQRRDGEGAAIYQLADTYFSTSTSRCHKPQPTNAS